MANHEQEDEEWFQNMGWHFNSNDDFVDKHGRFPFLILLVFFDAAF